MRFLVVDENKDFRTYLKEMITAHNDEYLELTDASELKSEYRKSIPDYVVIDLEMKQVSGFRAAKELLDEFPKARVIMLSGFYDERVRLKAEELTAAIFISKENLFEFYKIINEKLNLCPAQWIKY
jgi:DNA-binding NarL/FixJ family response regulator